LLPGGGATEQAVFWPAEARSRLIKIKTTLCAFPLTWTPGCRQNWKQKICFIESGAFKAIRDETLTTRHSTRILHFAFCLQPSLLKFLAFLSSTTHQSSLYVEFNKMSPKYWVSSEDLSADSSLEDSHSRSRGPSDLEEEGKQEDGSLSTAEGSIPRNPNDRAVSRTVGTNVTLPRLPNLQPQQHATLFYLSLIEGRCRTQAANTINAGRSPEYLVPEGHPDVLGLAQHLFTEMQRELVKAGLIPADFEAPVLSELRQYLHSFDNLLTNIASQRTFNLSTQQNNHRTLPPFQPSSSHSELVPYNAAQIVLPFSVQQTRNHPTVPKFGFSLFDSDFMPYSPGSLAIMASREQRFLQRTPSKLSLFFPKVQETALDISVYVKEYEQ